MADFNKTLFVVRHAHRDTAIRTIDNGLSEKGQLQALSIRDYLKSVVPPTVKLISSPKLRCQETLEPLAKALNIKLQIDNSLDERSNQESEADIMNRVSAWAKNWTTSKEACLVICSHGDWIPYFSLSLLGKPIDLSKGGLFEIKETAGKIILFDLKQHV